MIKKALLTTACFVILLPGVAFANGRTLEQVEKEISAEEAKLNMLNSDVFKKYSISIDNADINKAKKILNDLYDEKKKLEKDSQRVLNYELNKIEKEISAEEAKLDIFNRYSLSVDSQEIKESKKILNELYIKKKKIVGDSNIGNSENDLNSRGSETCKTTGPLGIPTWYRGLTSGNCEIEWPDGDTEKSFQKFITVIALNVSEMVLRLSGVMAVLFIVFGGFKYMLAQGDSSKVAGAKKTITNAVIGLAISLLSVVIVNTIFNLFK